MRGTGFYIFAMFPVSCGRFPLKISRQIMEQNSSSDLYLDELSVRRIIRLDNSSPVCHLLNILLNFNYNKA